MRATGVFFHHLPVNTGDSKSEFETGVIASQADDTMLIRLAHHMFSTRP